MHFIVSIPTAKPLFAVVLILSFKAEASSLAQAVQLSALFSRGLRSRSRLDGSRKFMFSLMRPAVSRLRYPADICNVSDIDRFPKQAYRLEPAKALLLVPPLSQSSTRSLAAHGQQHGERWPKLGPESGVDGVWTLV